MAISRSPQEFLKRKCSVPTYRPGPRFDPCGLLVHKYPTGFTVAKSTLAEGDPPPERAVFKDWSPLASEE